jgi:hypothetical protein
METSLRTVLARLRLEPTFLSASLSYRGDFTVINAWTAQAENSAAAISGKIRRYQAIKLPEIR